jgi:hypothetical protein
MDFIEVDAATNSGKADMQKITEEIQYSTFAGRRRIYLLDEAHQLSREALDAILKPLEESIPGTQDKRLVCIFCTTEPEKMRATIFSRCAPTFVIQPVAPVDIAKRLAYVCDQEGFEYDLDMLQVIAEMTECHIRDALKSVEGVSMLGKLDRVNVSKYLKLDMNLMFIDVLENIGRDLSKTISNAKEALLRTSPAVCYDKLATMAMLAYQVGIGAIKAPSYVEAGRLEALFTTQQQNLIGYTSRFASRLGRPTEAMLLCDLGSLHYGGASIGANSLVVVQPQVAPVVSTISSGFLSHPERSVPISGKVVMPVVVNDTGKKAEVHVNPKAVRNPNQDGVVQVVGPKGPMPEIDPESFSSLLAMQIAQYEGMPSGSSGRSDLGRY